MQVLPVTQYGTARGFSSDAGQSKTKDTLPSIQFQTTSSIRTNLSSSLRCGLSPDSPPLLTTDLSSSVTGFQTLLPSICCSMV
jgi:hypothetical protein